MHTTDPHAFRRSPYRSNRRSRRAARRLASSGALLALAAIVTACPTDPPTPPAIAGPSATTVIRPPMGASSVGPMPLAADGQVMAYLHSEWNIDFTTRTEAVAWNSTTGEHRTTGSVANTRFNPPAISADGTTVVYSTHFALPGGGAPLTRYDTRTGDVDDFPLPEHLRDREITQHVVSADGTVAALELSLLEGGATGKVLAVWTEDRGVEQLPSITPGTARSQHLPGVAISPSGRFVAGVSSRDLDGGYLQVEVATYDRVAGSWGNRWVSGPVPNSFGTQPVTVLATLDDGSVVFDLTKFVPTGTLASEGVRLWPRSGGVAQQLIPGDPTARGTAASADGRYIAYLASDPDAPADPLWRGEPFIYDRVTGTHSPAGSPGTLSDGATYPVAIGEDADWVVLYTRDAELITGPGFGLFDTIVLWDRRI